MTETDPKLAPADSAAKVETETSGNNRQRARISKLALLALLIALVCVAAIVYLFQLQLRGRDDTLLQSLQQQNQALVSQGTAYQSQLKQLNETLVQVIERQRGLEQQQRHSGDKLLGLEARFAELSHTDRSDWQMAEVEYLLRLAYQRVLDTKNSAVGLELLNAADDLLKELDSADLFTVRQQIADDRVVLENTAQIDIEGLYMRLNALSSQANRFEFERNFGLAEASVEAEPVAARNQLWALWDSVLGLYRVQQRDPDLAPQLTQTQQVQLKLRLVLLLDQAKLALLSSNQPVYEAALNDARELCLQFAVKATVKQAFEDEIDFLLAQTIVAETPDISGSHSLMQRYIRTRRLSDSAAPASPVSGEPES